MLAPLAIVCLPLIILCLILYFVLAPIAYPFLFALSLLFDNKILGWVEFKKMAHIYDEHEIQSIRK
jgi:hypothetical protein